MPESVEVPVVWKGYLFLNREVLLTGWLIEVTQLKGCKESSRSVSDIVMLESSVEASHEKANSILGKSWVYSDELDPSFIKSTKSLARL